MPNNSSLKKLFSDSVIYGLSSIVGRFLNYLLVPLYTYKIAASSGGYGVITNIYAYTALILVILTFGMETTFFFFANKYKSRSEQVFSTVTFMVTTVVLVFLLVTNIFTKQIANVLHYADHPEYIHIMSCVVGLDAIQAIFFALLRYQGRAWKFAFLKLLFIFCNIGLNLFIFLIAPGLNLSWYEADQAVRYVFFSNLICTTLITIFFIPEMRIVKKGMDKTLIVEMLRYTWPLLLLGLMGILNQVADKICYRFLVPGQEGDAQLGIYGACAKIAMIMAMITQAFRYAYEPFVFGNAKGEKSKESQASVMKYFIIFTLLAFLIVMAYLDILKYIIQRDYWEGLRTVPIVMMAEIFMGIYFNLSFWYKLTEKTWWGAIFSACGCFVLITTNILFVPRYGYMACAWGGFLGYGISMLLSYVVGQHYYPIPYPIKEIGIYMIISMALLALMQLIPIPHTLTRLIVNTLCVILFSVFIIKRERLDQQILSIVHKKRR